ncbi:exopolysaccharide biosynthesis GT4 family glycosyltransferase EpsE [Arthrobacter sp. BE255]|uniref:exopolysaccharide biosynthesis GT4 family glycosyltransferase EpsE n=1 Tax=Arthrobacter sp. BE255 TaxID=2817721 RepID=UPI00285EEC75|nr:exopolysaccharide biosynthesis GT4 family glycosyltransferase EpsE [Arthrobacter sp. BE255]MDR7160365.1 glycosyltransferase involved in cell wall biosynthesis [Arthrobacter sp. BE255]
MKFGYLVPEFPGQTHTFFWREVMALRDLGLQPELVSTRRPKSHMMPQRWAAEAESVTQYLSPLSPGAAAWAGWALIQAIATGRGGRIVGEIRTGVRRLASTGGSTKTFKGLFRLLGLLVVGAELAGLASRRGWTHVHVHSCADSAQIALFAHHIAGLTYSLTLHGPLGDYGPNQLGKWRQAEFATVITEVLLREINRELGPDVAARTGVAPMGVDFQQFSRQKPFLAWTGEGAARIFSCGRLNIGKGHDVLVSAVGQLVADGMDVQLVIAGEDEEGGRGYRQDLERLVSKAGLSGQVTLLGAVPEEEVQEQLANAHVFALASHAEPLGVAIMEAMSMEVPVVVTAGGGVKELVEDGVTGILVSPGDAAALADSIREVLTSPHLALSISRACREQVKKSFSSQRGARELADRIFCASRRNSANGIMETRSQ